MPLIYMNSWASLALRAAALVAFSVAALSGTLEGSTRSGLAATALLLAASAAHPLSLSLRLGSGAAAGLLAVAEGVIALAAMLGLVAAFGADGAAHAGALAAPLALALAVIALAGGIAQHDRMLHTNGGRGPALPVAIASGSAGVAVLAALQAEGAARAGAQGGLVLGAAALALAVWITHSALRLRRARRSAAQARLRDLVLASPAAPASRRLDPAAQWS
jgi:hypothetical protein